MQFLGLLKSKNLFLMETLHFWWKNECLFLKMVIFCKHSKGTPFEHPILGPLFGAVLDARSFFWTFFGKYSFGGDQKKCVFYIFLFKLRKKIKKKSKKKKKKKLGKNPGKKKVKKNVIPLRFYMFKNCSF